MTETSENNADHATTHEPDEPGREHEFPIMPYKDPDTRRAYDADHKRLRRAGCPTLSTPLVPPEVRLQTAKDVLALLAEQVNVVRADPDADALEKARTVGFLASVALRAIEAGDQQARIEALERALAARAADQKRAEQQQQQKGKAGQHPRPPAPSPGGTNGQH